MNPKRRWRTVRRVLLALLAGTTVLLVAAFLFVSRPFAEPPWVEAEPNSLAIYRNVASSRVDRAHQSDFLPFMLDGAPVHFLRYSAAANGALDMELRPDGGWTPGPGPRMARLLFRAISMFRRWPTTYLWRGTIQLPAPDAPPESPLAFHSGLERIEH